MILPHLAVFALLALAIAPLPASAEDQRHHALSLIGELQYPADFEHFAYVDPNAPKGGRIRMAGIGGFDSLNPILYKGESATGLGLIYEALTTSGLDEDSTAYGLLAEWMSYPEDFSSVTFKLRNGARWHDGKPVTVEDVIYSLEVNKQANPTLGLYYKNVKSAEETGDREVTFTFDSKNNRELPMIMGQLTILPKHWWTGKDAEGNQRDPLKTTMEPPLGSGAYKIGRVVPGRSISYQRVADYWGKDLPVNKGQWNYDEIQFDYYRDPTVAFEAFKAGSLDYHQESSAKNWATGYDFEAVKKGWVKQQKVPVETSAPMQSFVFNIRRDKFQDVRVRRAFNLAFDFEWSNKNLFFGQYSRVGSYFENTELAAPKALPTGRELEILNEVKDEVPAEVFTKVYENPRSDTKGGIRANLREAMQLLKQAGWSIKNGGLINDKTGEKMRVEFLIVSPLFERIVQPYLRNLKRLGIEGTVRLVDSAQYTRRLQNFNYDIVVGSFSQSRSPGNEQRDYWGSEAAAREGSQNLIGISDPAIDKLIDKIIFAKDRDDLVAATQALDRVLLWHEFVIPQWFSPDIRIAYWNRYGQPERLPKMTPGFLQVWWYDKEKAAKLPGGSG